MQSQVATGHILGRATAAVLYKVNHLETDRDERLDQLVCFIECTLRLIARDRLGLCIRDHHNFKSSSSI